MSHRRLTRLFGGRTTPTFTPASYGTDLKLWLRADIGVVYDVAPWIRSWADQSSGGARFASAYNVSKQTSTALNNQTVIRFGYSGAQTKLVADVAGSAIGANWSLLMVVSMPNTAGNAITLMHGVGDSPVEGFWLYGFGDSSTVLPYSYASDGASIFSGDSSTGLGATMSGVVMLESGGTSRICGAAGSAHTWTGAGRGIAWTQVGATLGRANLANSDVAEVICIGRAGGMPELGPYLQSRYGKSY